MPAMQAKLADLCICEKIKAWKDLDSNQDSGLGIQEPVLIILTLRDVEDTPGT